MGWFPRSYMCSGIQHTVADVQMFKRSCCQLYDVLTKGSGDAREQPLFFIITTAGTNKNSICSRTICSCQGRRVNGVPAHLPLVWQRF